MLFVFLEILTEGDDKLTIEKINKKLEKAKAEYELWLEIKSVYEACVKADIGQFPESAIRAYIITGTVTEAAKMLNDAHNRTERGKKFSSNDISNVIDNADIEEKELQGVAQFLLRNGRSFIKKLH